MICMTRMGDPLRHASRASSPKGRALGRPVLAVLDENILKTENDGTPLIGQREQR